MSKITVVTVAIILASGTLFAQRGPRGPRGPRGDGDRPASRQQNLKEAIGLSDEQLSEINELRREARAGVSEIFRTARENTTQLRQEMQKDEPDAATVGRLMVDSLKTRSKVSAMHSGVGEKVRGVLTDEQSSKLGGLANDPSSRMALMQARGLGLVEAPQRGPGPGFGRGGFGPGGFGFRGGRGFRGGQGFGGGRGFGGPQRFRGPGNDRGFERNRDRRGPERFRGRGGSQGQQRGRSRQGSRGRVDGPPRQRERR